LEVQKRGKKLRLATKSIRVPDLIHRALKAHPDVLKGLLCFSVEECKYLADELNLDDFLVAYPTVQKYDLEIAWQLRQRGKSIHLMVDCATHIEILDHFWDKKVKVYYPQGFSSDSRPVCLTVCIDMDMSFRLFGGAVHLGAHRSPVHTLNDFRKLVQCIQRSKHLKLTGVMAYEAQIAGVPDNTPYEGLKNFILRGFKAISKRDVAAKRKELKQWLKSEEIPLEFFNGGGTSSLRDSIQEDSLTEVTAGSGFLQSELFDYFTSNMNECAFVFGLQVTRFFSKNSVVCQSGGFIASGNISRDKAPVPFLPARLKEYSSEGFGEVQTPLIVPSNVNLKLGDPIFFRPAKAGEIAERFDEYLLKSGTKLEGRVKTYRGLGWNCF